MEVSKGDLSSFGMMEPDDLEKLLRSYSVFFQLALRSFIVWEKDIHHFFSLVNDLHECQFCILNSLLRKGKPIGTLTDCNFERVKAELEQEFGVLLPDEIAGELLNPYSASVVIASASFCKYRRIDEILRVISLIIPEVNCTSITPLNTLLINDLRMLEFILMLEELYQIQIPNEYLLLEDSIEHAACRITKLLLRHAYLEDTERQ